MATEDQNINDLTGNRDGKIIGCKVDPREQLNLRNPAKDQTVKDDGEKPNIGFPSLNDLQEEPHMSKFDAFGELTVIAAEKQAHEGTNLRSTTTSNKRRSRSGSRDRHPPSVSQALQELVIDSSTELECQSAQSGECLQEPDDKSKDFNKQEDKDDVDRQVAEKISKTLENTKSESHQCNSQHDSQIELSDLSLRLEKEAHKIVANQIKLALEHRTNEDESKSAAMYTPHLDEENERCNKGSKTAGDTSCSCSYCSNQSEGEMVQELSEIAVKLDIDGTDGGITSISETIGNNQAFSATSNLLEKDLDTASVMPTGDLLGLPTVSDHCWNYGERIGSSIVQDVYQGSQANLSKDDLALTEKSSMRLQLITAKSSNKDHLHRTSERLDLHSQDPLEKLLSTDQLQTQENSPIISNSDSKILGHLTDGEDEIRNQAPSDNSFNKLPSQSEQNQDQSEGNHHRLEVIKEESVQFDEMKNVNIGGDKSEEAMISLIEIVSQVSTENDVISCESDLVTPVQSTTSKRKQDSDLLLLEEFTDVGLPTVKATPNEVGTEPTVSGSIEVFSMANGMSLAENIVYGDGHSSTKVSTTLSVPTEVYHEAPMPVKSQHGSKLGEEQFVDSPLAENTPESYQFRDAEVSLTPERDTFTDAPIGYVLHNKTKPSSTSKLEIDASYTDASTSLLNVSKLITESFIDAPANLTRADSFADAQPLINPTGTLHETKESNFKNAESPRVNNELFTDAPGPVTESCNVKEQFVEAAQVKGDVYTDASVSAPVTERYYLSSQEITQKSEEISEFEDSLKVLVDEDEFSDAPAGDMCRQETTNINDDQKGSGEDYYDPGETTELTESIQEFSDTSTNLRPPAEKTTDCGDMFVDSETTPITAL